MGRGKAAVAHSSIGTKASRDESRLATLGRFDVVDVEAADDPKHIEKAAMIIRAYGHSTTETLLATTPWKEVLATLYSPVE